jgi:hypothetical protein
MLGKQEKNMQKFHQSIAHLLIGMTSGIAMWFGGAGNILAEIHSTLWLAALIMPLAAALSVFARFRKGRPGGVAHAFVQKMQQGVCPKLTRAVWLLAGVVVIALICWAVTGSGYALGVFLYGALLVAVLSYFLHGLIVFTQPRAQ